MPKNFPLDDTIAQLQEKIYYFSFDSIFEKNDNFSVTFGSRIDSQLITKLLKNWSSHARETKKLTVLFEKWFEWLLQIQESFELRFITVKWTLHITAGTYSNKWSFKSEYCEFKEIIFPKLWSLELHDTQIDKLTITGWVIDTISITNRSVIKQLKTGNNTPLITQSFTIDWISRLKWHLPTFQITNQGNFTVTDSEIDSEIKIHNSSLDLVKIEWKHTVVWWIEIVDSEFKNEPEKHPTISIQNITVNKWILIKNCSWLSKIKIHNIQFKHVDSFLQFEKFSLFDKSIFYLIDLKVAYLSFLDWAILNNQTKFNNIEVYRQLVIEDVNFWTTSFNGFQTSDECDVFIKLPVLKDGVFNNILFGKMTFMERVELDKVVYKNDLNEMRDVYRQFKYAMDKNNNYIEWNRFFQKEMEYQMQIIRKQISNSGVFRSIALRLEYRVYQLQNLVSNFWNSWIRTIISIIVFAFLSTLITSAYMKMWHVWYIYGLEERFTTFLNLLSPFYGISRDTIKNMQDFDKYLWSGFILYKIIYGILVYQLIVWLKRQTKR